MSLDGGGVRGIFSAAILAAIEDDLGVRVIDQFDLIVGTSTGGIIALGLGLGLSPLEIVDFYYERCRNVFRNPLGLRFVRHAVLSKYSGTALETALQNSSVFGNKILGQSTKALVIPSYSLSEDGVYIFKTDHHERFKRDWKVPAWQVARATCAAPTYFPTSPHIGRLRHIDGGVWANNPLMVGIAEAVSSFDCDLKSIRVLSLGTTNPICRRPTWLNNGGILPWACTLKDLFLKGQSLGAINQAGHLLGEKDVLRIDPAVPPKLFGLDKIRRSDDLLAKAAFESRVHMPAYKAKLADHKAHVHIPLNCPQVADYAVRGG